MIHRAIRLLETATRIHRSDSISEDVQCLVKTCPLLASQDGDLHLKDMFSCAHYYKCAEMPCLQCSACILSLWHEFNWFCIAATSMLQADSAPHSRCLN